MRVKVVINGHEWRILEVPSTATSVCVRAVELLKPGKEYKPDIDCGIYTKKFFAEIVRYGPGAFKACINSFRIRIKSPTYLEYIPNAA